MSQSNTNADRRLSVSLLDARQTVPLREWRFEGTETIRIGRASDNDISIRDPHVSRCQAALFFDGSQWQCSNFGRADMYVDGQKVPHVTLSHGLVIGWARSGPRIEARFSGTCTDSDTAAFSDDQPVSVWLEQLKVGDDGAAQGIWEKYFGQIVRLARSRLGHTPRRVADEEDVAVSVFNSLFVGVSEGRYPELAHRDNLWRLLVVMTARKAIDQIHHQRRQKRGGGRVRGESVLVASGASGSFAPGFAGLMGDEPTPEFAALLEEETGRLLEMLDDTDLRSIALLKLQGYTNDEIAGELGCVARTVERRLHAIRGVWSQEMNH